MISTYPVTILHAKNKKTNADVGVKKQPTHAETRRHVASHLLKKEPPFKCAVCHIRDQDPPNDATNAFTDTVKRERLVVSMVCSDEVCLAINRDLHQRSQFAGESGKCTVCGTETRKHCGKCQHVFYCGDMCQRKDWPQHKLVCGKKFLMPEPEKN